MYVAIPTFVGMAAARSVDDIGKAAFRPAWASAITDIAAKDPHARDGASEPWTPCRRSAR